MANNHNAINLDKMSIIELKALCFDIEQEMRQKEQELGQVAGVLQKRLNEEEKTKEKDK